MAMRLLIVRARTSNTPRKSPGKTSELLTWLGKSLRPVATICAPALRATSGQISGTGLAQASTTAFVAIVRIQALSFGAIVVAIKISKEWNKTRILLQRTDASREQT